MNDDELIKEHFCISLMKRISVEQKPPRFTPNNPKEVFEQAERFHLTAMVLSERFRETNNASYIMTMCVNSAFAIELYLKCLLFIEKGKYPDRIHKLDELFNKVSHKNQKILCEYYNKFTDEGRIKSKILEIHPDRKTDLISELSESANAFTLIRYIFDNKHFVYTVGDLKNPLHRLIMELKSEWRPLII